MTKPYTFRQFLGDVEELDAAASEVRLLGHSAPTVLCGQEVVVTSEALVSSVMEELFEIGLLDGPPFKAETSHGTVWVIPITKEPPLFIEKWNLKDAAEFPFQFDEAALWKAVEQ